MNDALEILDELEKILAMHYVNDAELLSIIFQFLEQKRIEYKPTTNAKWEEIK